MQSHWTSETSFFGEPQSLGEEEKIANDPKKNAKNDKHTFNHLFHSMFSCCSSVQQVEDYKYDMESNTLSQVTSSHCRL